MDEGNPAVATDRFRHLPAIVPGKTDCFMADPRLIEVDPDFNCRDMQSPETLAHIDWLADEIENQGFNPEMPLTVKRRGDAIVVIRGHCRLAACRKLIDKGVELVGIPVMQIASGTSDADLLFDQETSNFGLRLDPLARARIVKKAQRMGVEDAEIARRMHWKSVASIKQHLDLLEMPEPIKEHVRNGEISATLARNIAKSADPEEAEKRIRENLAENKRLGAGKRATSHKVTTKTLNRDRPKPAPAKPIAADDGPVPHGGLPSPAAPARPDSDQATPKAQPEFGREMPAQDMVDTFNKWTPPANPPAAPLRPNVRQLVDALAPFANLAHDHDFEALGDDHLIEVPIVHLKNAWVVFAKFVGEV